MGRISKFACPSCDMAWEVQLGHGMGQATLESVLDEFPANIRQKILEDTGDEQIPSFEFNYCPAVCRQCGKVVAVPVIYLHRTGHTYSAVCMDCGDAVTISSEDTELICPHCEKSKLAVDEVGRWD